jgi:hypothetical protein
MVIYREVPDGTKQEIKLTQNEIASAAREYERFCSHQDLETYLNEKNIKTELTQEIKEKIIDEYLENAGESEEWYNHLENAFRFVMEELNPS